MKRYNLKAIMCKAWRLWRAVRKTVSSFSEALKKAWQWAKAQAANAAKVEAAVTAAGIDEEVHSWYGWQQLGRQVIHGEKCVLQVVIDTPEKGEGKTAIKSLFTYSQTQNAPAA